MPQRSLLLRFSRSHASIPTRFFFITYSSIHSIIHNRYALSLSIYHFRCKRPLRPSPSLSRSTLEFVNQSRTVMARIALLFVLFVLPALVSSGRPMEDKYVVQGKVYCDTCLAGYETSASTYIDGAKVKIECRARSTMKLLFTQQATTDSSGCYEMTVVGDHKDQVCDVILISSPQKDCATISQDRDRARVILTGNNGIASEKRYVNSIAFVRDQPMSGCDMVLSQYQESDE